MRLGLTATDSAAERQGRTREREKEREREREIQREKCVALLGKV